MSLRALLRSEFPVIQAPMAGVQDSALAVAVSNAGGVGSLPCAMLGGDAIRNEIALVRENTGGPFNVNFFCHVTPAIDPVRDTAWRACLAPYYSEYGIDPDSVPAGPSRVPFNAASADILDELEPPIVSFHFGLPPRVLFSRVKATGAIILASATTVEEARWLEARGVDAVIAQGFEAGGHRGMFLSEDLATQVGTLALVTEIVRAVKVPVIAAGGIADAKGVAAAMALGASGVQIGTAYLLTPEATTSAVHRAALKSDAARQSVVTNILTGRPARGLLNRLMKELGTIRSDVPAFPLASAAIAPLRAAAESRSSGDFSTMWCGQNVSGCKEIPACELTRELGAGV